MTDLHLVLRLEDEFIESYGADEAEGYLADALDEAKGGQLTEIKFSENRHNLDYVGGYVTGFHFGEPLSNLRAAIAILVTENLGDLDEWEQEIVDRFNALPGVQPIVFEP